MYYHDRIWIHDTSFLLSIDSFLQNTICLSPASRTSSPAIIPRPLAGQLKVTGGTGRMKKPSGFDWTLQTEYLHHEAANEGCRI